MATLSPILLSVSSMQGEFFTRVSPVSCNWVIHSYSVRSTLSNCKHQRILNSSYDALNLHQRCYLFTTCEATGRFQVQCHNELFLYVYNGEGVGGVGPMPMIRLAHWKCRGPYKNIFKMHLGNYMPRFCSQMPRERVFGTLIFKFF